MSAQNYRSTSQSACCHRVAQQQDMLSVTAAGYAASDPPSSVVLPSYLSHLSKQGNHSTWT